MERYAEVYVYEASLQGGQMVWQPIAGHVFDREYLGLVNQQASAAGTASGASGASAFMRANDLLSKAAATGAAGPLGIDRSASPAADPELVKEVVNLTLAPASEPKKHRFLDCLPFKHGRVENRTINAPIPLPAP
jgi:hypothetical protein